MTLFDRYQRRLLVFDYVAFVKLHRSRLFYLIVVNLVVWLLSLVPYLNLVLTSNVLSYISLISSLVLIRPPIKLVVVVCQVLLLLSLLSMAAGKLDRAEVLGNLIYGALAVGLIQLILTKKSN